MKITGIDRIQKICMNFCLKTNFFLSAEPVDLLPENNNLWN